LEWRWHDEWIPDFQAGARPGSQPPTPATEPQSVMSATVRAASTLAPASAFSSDSSSINFLIWCLMAIVEGSLSFLPNRCVCIAYSSYSARQTGRTACKCSVRASSIHPGSDFMTMSLQADSKAASVSAPTISSAATSIFSQFSFASATPFNDSPGSLAGTCMALAFRCAGRALLGARRRTWALGHPHRR